MHSKHTPRSTHFCGGSAPQGKSTWSMYVPSAPVQRLGYMYSGQEYLVMSILPPGVAAKPQPDFFSVCCTPVIHSTGSS